MEQKIDPPNGRLERPMYSVVVPSYRSGLALLELLQRLSATFEEMDCATFEAIVVNDGCYDEATVQLLARCHDEFEARIINLSRNFGKPGALMAGFAYASGHWIVTIDDDLQQRPEDIPELAKLRDHDVVMAAHRKRQHGPLIRWSSWIKQWFDRIILGKVPRMTPLKIIRRPIIDAVLAISTNRPYLPALLTAATTDIVTVEVQHEASAYGKSRYSLWRRMRQFSDLLISNSSLATRSIAMIGFAVAIASFLLTIIFVLRRYLGVDMPAGWTSQMAATLVLGGLILFTLGIIGEYLIRILEAVSGRPSFVVRSTLGFDPHPNASGSAPNSPHPSRKDR